MENIRIKPFHVFTIDKRYYVLRTRSLFYDCINESEYSFLLEREGKMEALANSEEIELFYRFRLIASPDDPRDYPGYLELDRKAWKTALPHVLQLRTMELMVTQECNMACVYCYGQGGHYGGRGHMDIRTAKLAVDWFILEAKEAPELTFVFFGGEPLLNFSLIRDIVSYVKEKEPGKKVSFGLTTNATLLNDEIIDFFVAEGIRPLISFDGPPEYQRNNRIMKNGKDSYELVIDNIRKLQEKIPDLHVRATLWKDADENLVLKELKRLGFSDCQVIPATPCLLEIENKKDPADFCMKTDIDEYNSSDKKGVKEERIYLEEYENLKEQVKTAVSALKNHKSDVLVEIKKNRKITRILSGWEPYKKYQFCAVGRSMLVVAVDGKIYPCHRFVGAEKFCLGSIHTQGPCKRLCFESHQLLENAECIECFARFACGGSCAYDNLVLTGNIFHPPEHSCDMMRKESELAIHVDSLYQPGDREFLEEVGILKKGSCIFDF